MLRHLKTTYGILTGTEIEQNRAKLTEKWDTSSPMESLWACIAEIRRVATNANQPIGNMAVMSLVLPMFERTGLSTSNVDAWNSLDPNTHTYATFMTHFTQANELCVTKLTSAALGLLTPTLPHTHLLQLSLHHVLLPSLQYQLTQMHPVLNCTIVGVTVWDFPTNIRVRHVTIANQGILPTQQ
jgi:hypothetical protein